MTLLTLSAAWMAGILLASRYGGAWWAWLLAALPALAGAVLARGRPRVRLAFACMLLALAGGARFRSAVHIPGESTLDAYNNRGFVTLDGMLVDAPDVRDTHLNLRVAVESITLDDSPRRPVSGLALVQTPRREGLRYGDPVRVVGEMVTPPELEGFSYRDYLARQNVYSLVRFATVEVAGDRAGSPLRAAMLDLRTRFDQTIIRLLPDPQSALLSGILLGIESRISPAVRDAFNAVSATHVIAISGSNLVILAGVVQALAVRVLPRPRIVAALTIAVVVGYAIFVGGDAAVIRAAIMTTLALVAGQLGRQTYGLASLGFAALLMSALDPRVLWDVSFQLSFLATLGLVLYVEPMQRGLESLLARGLPAERAREVVGGLSDAVLVTTAAQITTTPIMAATFGRLSLLSFPVNLLIVPAQTPLMISGGLAVLAAQVWPPLGQALAWVSWVFLTWTVEIVRVFARLPFASVGVSLSPLATWLLYAALFGTTALAYQPTQQRQKLVDSLRRGFSTKLAAAGGIVATVLLLSAAAALPDGRLHVTVFDVGDGSAALIQTADGRQILVDAGGGGRQLATGLGRALPFWDRHLDLLVLTGSGQRQTAALPAIEGRYRFDAVLAPPAADANGLPAQWMPAASGMRVTGVDTTLTILRARPGDDTLALRLDYGSFSLLIPGEGGLPAGVDAATVLLLPRGGHRDAAPDALLSAAAPRIAVIPVEAGNRFDLPHEETLARLEQAGVTIYRTDVHGTVRIVTDGAELIVKTER